MKNINIYLLALLVVNCILPLAAQQNGSESGLFIGASLGLQTTKFKLTEDYQDAIISQFNTGYQFRPKLGFSGGARLGFKFSEGFEVYSDIKFERNFYRYETLDNFIYQTNNGESLTGLIRIEETINRISFPLLARIKILGALSVTAGTDFSMGLKGKGSAVLDDGVKTTVLLPSTKYNLGNSRFDEYVGFNAGFVLGFGAVAPIGDELFLTFDLQRKWGFTDQYSAEQKLYREQTEGETIYGSKFLRGMYFSIGVQKTIGVY